MPVILADVTLGGLYTSNPHLTPELSEYAVDYWPGHVSDVGTVGSFGNAALMVSNLPVSANGRAILADEVKSFGDDFYDRIHLDPPFFDFGTIASPQVRDITVWNAWRDTSALLSAVTFSAEPLILTGTIPATFLPLSEKVYQLTVTVTGAPDVDTGILFDFSNVPDPAVLLVTATRAVQLGVIPEIPVKETWSWLTDIQVATDGTEQRIAVRGEVPRVQMDLKAIFDNKADLDIFFAQILSSAGRIWVPEYQYAALTTAAVLTGASVIPLDTSKTDIRDGEYILVNTKTTSFLSQVLSVGASSVTLKAPVQVDIPKGSLIAPGAPSLLRDATTLRRYAVDTAGETELNCRLQRYRATLTRPGVAEVAATYLGSKVLERRPLAMDLVSDAYVTGQEDQDNDTGVFDIISNWDYTRYGGARSYKIDRAEDPAEMDYWKEILSFARGKARMFWTPTYRNDFSLQAPASASTTITILGTDYALKVWPVPTHKHLEIETEAGIHRIQVLSATDSLGDSILQFTPPWPAGTGWDQIKRVSLLLPVRLDSDEVTWNHYGLESILDLSIRTAEEQLA